MTDTATPMAMGTIRDELATIVANAIALTHFADTLDDPRLTRCALDLSNRLQKLETALSDLREVSHG